MTTEPAKRGRPRMYADMEKELIAMLRTGMAIRAVARETGVPKSIVHRLSQESRSQGQHTHGSHLHGSHTHG
jgi:transposase-like protein